MRTIKLILLLLLPNLLLAEEPRSKVTPNPAFDKMKTLVGSWEGLSTEGRKTLPCDARFQVVADGSVLMGWLNEHTPDEMVTMFHPDGANLMATHYCAAHNQPRMVLVPGGDANKLVFKFKDGTNIDPDTGHMNQVTFILDRPNHHVEEWTYLAKGKEVTAHFEFNRTH